MIELFTKERGFTLIELLVVVAIIGLLISVIVVSTGPPREKAKDARRQTDIREIMNAMGMCYSDDGQYPDITVDAESKVTNTSIASGASGVKTYLSPFPKDPNGTNYYGEPNGTNHQQYCIYAVLAPSGTYFCASEKGVLSSLSSPSLGACCY